MLVEQRTASFASLNSTNIRFVCGTNGTPPVAAAKTAEVGGALASIVVETLAAGAASQAQRQFPADYWEWWVSLH
jgi:hypothetical protein